MHHELDHSETAYDQEEVQNKLGVTIHWFQIQISLP